MVDSPPKGIAGVLLAAGRSARFGSDKQLATLDGAPLLRRAALLLVQAGFDDVIVVLRPQTPTHRAALDGLPLRIVENPDAASGMASSLVVALDAAEACAAVVVTVCDQPSVTPGHLQALVARWREGGGSIVASGYGDTHGVPALFAAAHFPELRQLRGDRGAGPLLARHAASLAVVPLAQGQIDIDTPADLAKFIRP